MTSDNKDNCSNSREPNINSSSCNCKDDSNNLDSAGHVISLDSSESKKSNSYSNNKQNGCGCNGSFDDGNEDHSSQTCEVNDSSDFCSCGCGDDFLEEKEENWKKKPILIITTSAIILALGLYLDFFAGQKIIAELVFLAVVVLAGYEIIKKGILSLIKGRFTMNLLITLAVIGAFLIGEGAEGASVIFLFFVAEFLETYAGERARRSISSLIKLAPQTATLKEDGKSRDVPVYEVNINDVVVVRPGDKIPLDGTVIRGKSSVDQAAITGESIPVNKIENDIVFAGTLNIEGYLEIKVTQSSDQTLISKIIDMVHESKSKKSKTETFIEKFAHYYTPAVIVLAVTVALIPPFVMGLSFETWFYRALVLLVVSCPCALAISTPISMVSAITAGTNNGVLIKGGEFIEKMQNTDVIVFDKTGTLTEGQLELTDILPLNNYSKKELLGIAASLESQSKHPLADAIVKHAYDEAISFSEVHDFESLTGEGLKGKIDDKTFYIGKKSLFKGNIEFPGEIIEKLENEGKTAVIIGNDHHLLGVLALMDKIRPSSKGTVENLKNRNVKTMMLTGDNKGTAKAVASKLVLDEYYYELLPQNKVKIVENLLQNNKVAFVGDGVNDAPALAIADVGIAMGAAGSDVAIETADIALMHDDISKVDYLIELSKKTMGVVKQNVTAAILIKTSFAVLSVMGFITLWMAVAIGDMGLSLAVILNALRIGRKN